MGLPRHNRRVAVPLTLAQYKGLMRLAIRGQTNLAGVMRGLLIEALKPKRRR